MTEISMIGLDLAKSVFQLHGVNAVGNVVLVKRLRRAQMMTFFERLSPCVIGMEACASAHDWARRLQSLGHEVRLLAPSDVKPYVRRGQKNDARDAAAICEAMQRPGMRFVPVKSVEQQSVLMLHKSRALLLRQRTMTVNALRGHLAEFGIVARTGFAGLRELVRQLRDETQMPLPILVRETLLALAMQIDALTQTIKSLEQKILAWHKNNEASRRLADIPGVGPLSASALVATIGDVTRFRSGRHLAAWLGLVPRQHSSGGHERLGRISKMGDPYLRRLLVLGATSMLNRARGSHAPSLAWTQSLLARKPARLVSVALANKTARIVWALLARGDVYRTMPLVMRAA